MRSFSHIENQKEFEQGLCRMYLSLHVSQTNFPSL